MLEHVEHEPSRRVIFHAGPMTQANAAGSLSQLTGGVVSVLFALAAVGVLVLGGTVFWTTFEPPDPSPTPLWMEPPEPYSHSTDGVEDRCSALPGQQPAACPVRDDVDSTGAGSGGSEHPGGWGRGAAG